MSEFGKDTPRFNSDIDSNAIKNDVFGPQTLFTTIVGTDSEIYGSADSSQNESDYFVSLRRTMIRQTENYMRHGEYGAAISELKWILKDLDHAQQLNQSREFEIREIMELCYEMSARATGSVALAEIVSISDAVPVELVPPSNSTLESIAS